MKICKRNSLILIPFITMFGIISCVEDPPEEEWHVPDNPIDTTDSPVDTIPEPIIFFSDTAKVIPLGTTINLGAPELMYDDASLPIRYDSPLTTIKKSADSMYFYHSYGCRINPGAAVPSRHTCFAGKGASPLDELVFEIPEEDLWDYQGWYSDTDQEGIWIMNAHKLSNGDLLGIAHSEYNYPGEDVYEVGFDYSVGIAYSSDMGQSWTFCGEAVRSKARPDTKQYAIAGGPYLIIGDYMYLYYNDYAPNTIAGSGEIVQICAVRANYNEVVEAAKNGTIPLWYKYRDGAWDVEGLNTSISGSGVVKNEHGNPSSHTDAVYCASLQKYLILAQFVQTRSLWLYSSVDGINWTQEQVVDDAVEEDALLAYAVFVDYDGPSDDCLVVDNDFWIYYPHKSKADHNVDDMYRVHVTIE